MDQKLIRSWLIGISFILLSLLLFLSLVSFDPHDLSFFTSSVNNPIKNYIGLVGANAAGAALFLFGKGAFVIFFALLFLGMEELSFIDFRGLAATVVRRFFSFFMLVVAFSVLFAVPYVNTQLQMFHRGGLLGYGIAQFLVKYLNFTGTYIVVGLVLFTSSVLFCGFFVYAWTIRCIEFAKKASAYSKDFLQKKKTAVVSKKDDKKDAITVKAVAAVKTPPKIEIYTPPILTKTDEPSPLKKSGERDDAPRASVLQPLVKKEPVKAPAKDDAGSKTGVKPLAGGVFNLPSENLLSFPEPVDTTRLKEDIEANARVLEETLAGFDVQAKVVSVQTGPVVTRYELEPAPGVKIQRIVSLADDITLAMKSSSVRIVAPIPGKGAVGVEIPNQYRISVFVREIISDKSFKNSSSILSLALGKDTAGVPYVTDLNDMPHLLIAGATGSGKTVCVNTLICSILFKATPDKVKFLMVDPKTVELAPYKDIPHLIHPIITDAKKASLALMWLVEEMEKRYKMLSTEGARNIDAYNAKEFRMPYIVVIIDELADLMIVARETIETNIQRLAQLSRAVGIHLVLATQRPSVDVITGVIKANFPARISFKVSSRVDSRTVLDFIGAERLIGKGDMLFTKAGLVKPLRLQGCFVSDEDITKLIEFIRTQGVPEYSLQLAEGNTPSRIKSKEDELFDESVTIVLETRQASASILQRRLRVGYNRAARLIDLMEEEGIVGPFQGSKPRQILMSLEEWRAAADAARKQDNYAA